MNRSSPGAEAEGSSRSRAMSDHRNEGDGRATSHNPSERHQVRKAVETNAAQRRQDIAQVPTQMCERLLQQFEVNGAVPLTGANMQ